MLIKPETARVVIGDLSLAILQTHPAKGGEVRPGGRCRPASGPPHLACRWAGCCLNLGVEGLGSHLQGPSIKPGAQWGLGIEYAWGAHVEPSSLGLGRAPGQPTANFQWKRIIWKSCSTPAASPLYAVWASHCKAAGV